MRAILCTVAVLTASVAGAQPPAGELKLGVPQGLFRDVKPNMVHAMSKPLRELIAKQTGYIGDVEICPDALALAAKLKDKTIHVGVFHGFEFAWAKTKCDDLVPLIVTRPPGGKVQSVVVVRVDAPYKTLADVKDEPVVLPRGSKAHSLVFLDKLRIGFDKDTAKPQAKATQTAEDVLSAIANGDVAATVVDVNALDGYRSLQPGGFKQLRVLLRSEEFPAAVVAYRKGALTDAEATLLRDGLASAEKTATGKLLMTLWNLQGFEPPPANHAEQLDAILKAYPCPAASEPAPVRRVEGRIPAEK